MHTGACSDGDSGHHTSEDHDGWDKGVTRYGVDGGDAGRVYVYEWRVVGTLTAWWSLS